MKIMLRLARLVRPLAGMMALAVALGVLGNLAAVSVPLLGTVALLRYAAGSTPAAPLAAAAVCALLRGAARYGEQTCNHYIAFKLLAHIRERVFFALRRLCPAKLERRGRGDLVAVITADIELLEVFYAHTISPAVIAAAVSLCMVIFVGSYHPLFALVAAAGYLTVGVVFPAVTSRLVGPDGAKLRAESGRLSAFWLDGLRGLAELSQYGLAARRGAEIRRRTESCDAVRRRISRREGIAGAAATLAVAFFSLLTLICGLRLRGVAGAQGAEFYIVPFVAVFSSFGPVLALANLSGTLPSTLAAGRRVLDILDEQPETPDVTQGLTPEFTGAETRDLRFSYGEAGTEALRGVSVGIKPRGITGITGRSGAGKSTLLRLLMRFWSAPRGSVLISGEEIGEIDTAHLRRLEGFMTQETDLFRDSIEANILVGSPGAGRDEVIAAAKKASLHDFVMTLPRGYDTPVAELGSSLSGGERQRIGLARAFLHGAPLLLLDEPTSNLDSLNEGVILKALREESALRAVALVSHRRSTAAIADEVYSVE
jgi:ABC-type transport system involved in cytochrome bd biosynthesis fused ATPase/permease subunit